MAAAVLTVLTATIVAGTVLTLVIMASVPDRPEGLPAPLELSIVALFVTAFLPATVVTAPLTVFLARITQPWRAAVIALCASLSTCLAMSVGIGDFIGHALFNWFHWNGDDQLFFRVIPANVIQTASMGLFCWGWVPFSAPANRAAIPGLRSEAPVPEIVRFGTVAERKLFCVLLLSIVLISGISFLVFRDSRLQQIAPDAWNALRQPREMTLYSLGRQDEGSDRFQGYEILGQVAVTDSRTHTRIDTFTRRAVIYSFGGTSMCFSPRHGLRVSDGQHTFDFLICFECHQLYVMRDDALVGGSRIQASREPLDAILRAANVPLDFPDAKIE